MSETNDRKVIELLERLLRVDEKIAHYLKLLAHRMKALDEVDRFFVVQTHEGTNMANGIAPGGTGTFTATPIDKNGNPSTLPAGVVPVWTSSDTTNAPVVAAADGLSATVTIPTSATGGEKITLSVTATLPDGTTPEGTGTFSVLTLEVASFTITQTA
jgi:hypothetical protein